MGNRQCDLPKMAQVSHLILYRKDAHVVLTDIYITDMLLCASFRQSNTKDMHSEKKKICLVTISSVFKVLKKKKRKAFSSI